MKKKMLFLMLVVALLSDSSVVEAKKKTAIGKAATIENGMTEETELKNVGANEGYSVNLKESSSKEQASLVNLGADTTGNVTYTLSASISATLADGVLTITGSGSLPKYESYSAVPWYNDNRENIKSVVIGEGITSISKQLFADCYNMETVSFPTTLASIGNGAFFGCYKLTSVHFPDSLKTLEAGAFADCSGIQEIVFGIGLETIGNYAFQKVQVKELNIPSGVKTIGDGIGYSSGIEKLSIPATATSVGAIGSGMKNLKEITVEAGNQYYKSTDGVLFDINGKSLFCYPAAKEGATYIIPSTVTTLENEAFRYASNLKNVTIGSNVTTIKDWVFTESKITSAEIPDSVTELGDGPFDQCYYLVSAVIGSGIKQTPYRLFQDCTSLESVTFKEGLEIIYLRCMVNCNKITTVKLPSTVKEISDCAFYYCENLENIDLPSGIEYIAWDAFYGSDKVTFLAPEGLTVLPDGTYMKTINLKLSGNYNYSKAYEVLDIVNAERAKVGLAALTMDMDLLDAAMLRSAENCICFDHQRPSGLSCFSLSNKIQGENIAVGSSTAKDTMKQWMESPGHKANILGSDYKTIGIGCFNQNGMYYWVQVFGSENPVTGTKPADAKVSVDVIVSNKMNIALYYPQSDLVIYEGKEEQITPAIVNMGWSYVYAELDPTCFTWTSGNTKVATVNDTGVVKGVAPGRGNVTFALKDKPSVKKAGAFTVSKNTDKNGNTIHIEEKKDEEFVYKKTDYKIIDTKKKTVSYVANTKKTSKTVTIPETVLVNGEKYKVTQIENNAFKNNKYITTLKLGKNVTSIGDSAFYGCKKLKTVKMNSKLTKIGNNAFKNCEKLSAFSFPKTLKQVGKSAFYACKNMKTLTVQSTKLKDSAIGSSAFKKTYSKMQVKVPKSKVTTYKKVFQKKGLSKKAKVTK